MIKAKHEPLFQENSLDTAQHKLLNWNISKRFYGGTVWGKDRVSTHYIATRSYHHVSNVHSWPVCLIRNAQVSKLAHLAIESRRFTSTHRPGIHCYFRQYSCHRERVSSFMFVLQTVKLTMKAHENSIRVFPGHSHLPGKL